MHISIIVKIQNCLCFNVILHKKLPDKLSQGFNIDIQVLEATDFNLNSPSPAQRT